jgi:hypothetical protein
VVTDKLEFYWRRKIREIFKVSIFLEGFGRNILSFIDEKLVNFDK